MPISTDINLPRSKRPIFPDSCVVCRCSTPNNTVKIGTNSIGWWTAVTLWFGKRFSVRVPACKRCAFKLQLRRWGAILTFMVLAYLVLAVIVPLISPHVPRALRRWALIIAVLLCMSPFFLWETLFPPAFELTAYSDTVDYEFRDESYAIEFGLLNQIDWDRESSNDAEGPDDDDTFPHIVT